MRSLEQIHLDELEHANGFTLNLSLGYARRLAQVAANKYGRTFGVFENEDLRYTVSSRDRSADQRLYEVMKPDRTADTQGLKLGFGSMRTPSESPVVWNPMTDIPVANAPRGVISGFAEHVVPGAGTPVSKIDAAEVYVSDGPTLEEARAFVWAGRPVKILGEQLVRRSGTERRQGQDRRLASRSTEYVLVGTYEIVVGQGAPYPGENTVRYKRLNYTSVPADMVRTDELTNQLTDALNTVAFMEHGLDPAGVLSIVRADKWEEENEEVLI